MRKLPVVFLQSLIFSVAVRAGSITISILDVPIYPGTFGNAASVSGSACVTPYLGSQNCVGQHSLNSAATPFGVAQAEGTEPFLPGTNYPGNPPTLQGLLVGPYGVAENSVGSLISDTFVDNTLAIFPATMVNFAPGGADGTAHIAASQSVFEAFLATGALSFAVDLAGQSSASFTLDPTTGTLTLATSPGVSGDITLQASGNLCIDYPDGCFFPGDPVFASLIFFDFVDGVVTASSNSLGLALPAVGASANFTLTGVSPFSFTFPLFNGLQEIAIPPKNMDSQSASLVAPEPGTIVSTFAALGALLIFYAKRQKRYTQTNAPVSGSRLPSTPGA